jgi:protein involved in polysaccharide export with SLBB domain
MIRCGYLAFGAFLLAGSAAGQGQSPVTVQPKAIVVTGSVLQPGVYPVYPSGLPTVLGALAQSGGMTEKAGRAGIIYRADDRGVTHEIPINLGNIMSGKQPDMLLQAGDVLYVPDGKGADRQPIRDLLPPAAERI